MYVNKNLLTFFILTITLTSCIKKEFSLQLTDFSAELYTGETFQITTKNGTNLHFQSKDRSIAQVDENTGLVTAITVGDTFINIDSDQGTKSFRVYVLPRYNLFEEPCHDFDKTKSNIISKYGEPFTQQNKSLTYSHKNNEIHPFDIYEFDDNDKLAFSSAIIGIPYAIQAEKFLSERYIPLGYMNSILFWQDKLDNPTTVVAMQQNPSYPNYYMIIYAPYSYFNKLPN